ncbi:MAG: hypothetical protein FJ276_13445 [Planctomycetes bacterium]|nr:hypothetical protein [Planctomycetota bacterium]
MKPAATFLGTVLAAIALNMATGAETRQGSSSGRQFDKAFVSFRIGMGQSMSESRFTELLDLFDKYPGVTDEVTLFTTYSHAVQKPELFESRVQVLAKRIAQARARGYRSGYNILCVMGHHNENLPNSIVEPEKYTQVTDIAGATSQGSLCPNDPDLVEQMRWRMQLMMDAKPDYIWLDDDIRLAGHMPVNLTCFCEHCLAKFGQATGRAWTREQIQAAADQGSLEEKLAFRRTMLQHNRDTINGLFKALTDHIRAGAPEMPLGFMTGDRFWEGYDFARWGDTLAGTAQGPVMWRPGGGYYEDSNTGGLVDKSHAIGRQVSQLADHVLSIQSEIENFPYQRLKKAQNIVALEAAQHIAAGCTGAAFNVLGQYDEPLDEFEPLVARLHRVRPFLDTMVRHLGRSAPTGVHVVWNQDLYAAVGLEGGSWFSGGVPFPDDEMFDIGIPCAYDGKASQVHVLTRGVIHTLDDREIREILSQGVYMDGPALDLLNARGFGDLTGFRTIGVDTVDRMTEFLPHPLNGPFAGRQCDNRQSFVWWMVPAHLLEKTNAGAESLARLLDYSWEPVHDCAMGVFENKLGGRVCVQGYYPWTYLQNLSRSWQLKSVMRWLSRDSLPGYVNSYHKMNLWVRQAPGGQIALALTNASFDEADGVELLLRTESGEIRVWDMDNDSTVVESAGLDGPYRTFPLPSIPPWELRLIATGATR